MAWGLSKNGFNRPNQAEIREDLDEQQRELFGADVNLNDKSPNGIINGILSYTFAKLWELTEKVWHSSHPSQAIGKQLDYLTVFFGTQRRRSRYAMVTLTIKGTPNYVVPFGRLYERSDENDAQYMQLEDCVLDESGNGKVDATCVLSGYKGNAPIGVITVQVEPDSDVISVTNETIAEGGVDEETDEELRVRLEDSHSTLGSGTINAIYSDLIAVDGVRAVKIKVNEKSVEVDGLPPHSIGVYTFGGNEKEIAAALMTNYTGIQFFGTTVVATEDASGTSHDIGFSKAVTKPIAVDVDVKTDSTFSTRGVNDIKNAIVKVIGGIDTDDILHNGLNMGDDVVYMQLANAVMNVQGVVDVSIKMGEKGQELKPQTVEIGEMFVASIETSDIKVVTS